jgi:uncharacterized ion transporter superfamily protein YfcC
MNKSLILKVSQATSLILGVAFTSFNLISFTVVKNGYYFKDDNQYWLALGVSLLAVNYVMRNWKKM